MADVTHFTIPTLTTPRLRLRPPRADDRADHVAMWADRRVTEFIGGEPRPADVSWTKQLAGAGLWPVMGFGYWVFADRASDRLIGMGGLAFFGRGIAELDGVPEAGWAFDADHWGQGLATEAMHAVLHWADMALDHGETRCIIDAGNRASERVAAKLGYAPHGTSDALGHVVTVFRRPRAR